MHQSLLKRTLSLGLLAMALHQSLPAATLVWTNTAGGLWSSATNWSPNQIPAAADSVAITNAGSYTVTSSVTIALAGLSLGDSVGGGTQRLVLAAGTLTITNATARSNSVLWLNGGSLVTAGAASFAGVLNQSSGTWQLKAAATVGTYNLTNGTLRGGTLTVTNFNWTDGSLYADANGDKLIIPASGILNLLGIGEKWLYYNAPANQGYGLDNHGTWNWSGACILRGFGSTVNNHGTVTVSPATGNPQYADYGAGYPDPIWNNYGTFTKAAGSGTFYFSVANVNNSGLFESQAGTLSMYGANFTNQSAVALGVSGVFQNENGAESAFLPASVLTAPTPNSVRVGSGTMYFRTTQVSTPALWINGGTLWQQTNNVVPTINQSAGTWRLAVTTAVHNYNLTNGTLRGGTLTVTNFNWTDGNLYADANGDKLIIPASGILNLLGIGEKWLYYNAPANQGYGLDNYGTWNWSGACILRGFGSTVNNHGTVTVSPATGNPQYADYGAGYPDPIWNNYGTFTKAAGSGTFNFSVANVNNTGLFASQAGTLSMYGANFTNQATVSLGVGGVFQNENGAESAFLPASTLTAPTPNSVRVGSGTVYLQTTQVSTPALWINGGTLWQQTNNVVPTINQSAGNWRLALTTAVNTYNLTNGTLRGGTLTVTNFNWTDGNLYADANGDKLIIPASGILNLLGIGEKWLYYNAPANQGYGLDNYGVWDWSGACILRGFGSTVNNHGTVTVSPATGNPQYADYGAGYPDPIWNNYGTFTKAAGSGTFYFSVANVNNTGLFESQAGTLSMYGANFTNQATVSLGVSGVFQNESGAESAFLPTSTLTAPTPNSVRVGSGTVYLQTTQVSTPALWINGGTLWQQTNNVVPTINQSAGTWRLALTTAVHNYNLTNGTLRGGTLTVTNFNWTDGNLYADANGDRLIIPGNGVFNLLGTGEKWLYYNAPASQGYGLDNYGTWNWSGACILRGFGSTVNNHGTVTISPATGNPQYADYGAGYPDPIWNNYGRFTKAATPSTFTFSAASVTNRGAITSVGGSFRFGGPFVQTAGNTSLGTNFSSDATVRIEAGTFAGRGAVAGQLYNSGVLNPGASPGLITTGSFSNAPAGQLLLELGGLVAGTNHDQIRVTGTASLTGLVQVALVNGFTPTVGNSFTVMTYTARSGVFENIAAPIGYSFQPIYTATNLILNAVAYSNVPPVITLHPTNQTVFAGTTVRLHSAATGTEPVTFQWKFKGFSIPGATNTWLEIPSAQNVHAGTYRVDVANLGGFANSSNALLTVVPGFTFGTNFNLPVNLAWNSVALQNSRVGYLAGPTGTVLATCDGGATWTSIGPGVTNTLYNVQMIDGAIFVFGSGGYICVSYDGGLTWQLFQSGTTETIRSGHFTDLTSGWAVGDAGTVYQFTNNAWTPQSAGSAANFHGVWSSGGSVWAVGSGGTICRWNGSWTCGSYGGYTFYGVSFWPGGVNGLAVGAGGTIYRTTNGGDSWFPVASGTTADLYSVATTSFGGVNYAWIGGAGGTLLFSGNGGGGWSVLGSGTTAGITGVVFRDGYGIYSADDGSCRHFNFAPIPANWPPAVAMLNQGSVVTNLASGALNNPACVPLSIFAIASDPDGTVTNLEFTVASRYATNNFTPRRYPRQPGTYSFLWVNDLVGEFLVSAIATDNRGAVASALPLTINAIKGPPLTIIPGGFQTTNGSFKLCMCAETNHAWTVWANQDLATTNWVPIGPMTFTNDLWRYFDLDATNYIYRFYRARRDP